MHPRDTSRSLITLRVMRPVITSSRAIARVIDSWPSLATRVITRRAMTNLIALRSPKPLGTTDVSRGCIRSRGRSHGGDGYTHVTRHGPTHGPRTCSRAQPGSTRPTGHRARPARIGPAGPGIGGPGHRHGGPGHRRARASARRARALQTLQGSGAVKSRPGTRRAPGRTNRGYTLCAAAV